MEIYKWLIIIQDISKLAWVNIINIKYKSCKDNDKDYDNSKKI